jgi:hypothetical protein
LIGERCHASGFRVSGLRDLKEAQYSLATIPGRHTADITRSKPQWPSKRSPAGRNPLIPNLIVQGVPRFRVEG